MKSLLTSVTLFVLVAAPNAARAAQEAAPWIPTSVVVARVNGEAVTQSQFDRMLANPLTLQQAQAELGTEEPDRRELERLAMKRVIHLRLLVQEAVRRGITVTQDELDKAISDLRRRFDDLKAFGQWIKAQGLNDPELFETVRTDMLAERATAALIADARISDEEARQYFEAHKDDLVIALDVRLRIIAVPSKAEADEVMAAIRDGVAFDRLARRRSIGQLARKGGDTGWVNARTLPPIIQTAVAELKPGEVRGPFEKAKDEFLVIGLQDRRTITARRLSEARPEIERRLLPAKQRAAVATWLAEQEKRSKIEVFLQKHTSSRTSRYPTS